MSISFVDQVKSAIRVTQIETILDLIFPMQVALGNKKSFGKWSRWKIKV